jgi:hypothetical protein
MLVSFNIRQTFRAVLPAAIVLLTACAQSGGATTPSAPGVFSPGARTDVIPPSCRGQKTSANHAQLSVSLSSKGGSLCVPAFDGFGGTMGYPATDPAVKISVISSTTNYDKMPQLEPAKAIFYLQLGMRKTSFGFTGASAGALTAAAIIPSFDYTIIGQGTVGKATFALGPCYAVATAGKYGGVIADIGAVLNGAAFSAAGKAVIEIYSGQFTQTSC